jgi:hypothetical protein
VSTFLSARLRTVRDRFRVTRLSGGGSVSVQQQHIPCASPCMAVHLDCFADVAWLSHAPRWGITPTTTISPPSPSSSRKEGDPAFRHASTSEHDVGHPLISLLDLIGHRPRGRGCNGREASPLHLVAPLSDVAALGASRPDRRLDFKQSSFTPIARVLRRAHLHVFGEPPRSRQAVVPFGFPRQVSR